MKKKLLMVLISIMLVFTITVTKPVNEVKALALSTAVLYTTYVLGGLAIASLADQGFNDGQATQAVWDGTKDFVQNGGQEIVEHVQTSIARTVLLGHTAVNLGERFYELTREKMAEWSQSLKSSIPNYEIQNLTVHSRHDFQSFNYLLNNPVSWNGQTYDMVRLSRGDTFINRLYNSVTGSYVLSGGIANATDVLSHNYGSSVQIKFDYSKGNLTRAAAADTLDEPFDVFADQVGKSVDKSFEHSKKQGKLNIPLDGMAGLGAAGIGLSYDSATDTWRDNATGEAYLGDVELDNTFVTPRVSETGATVYNPDIDLPVVDVNVRDVPWTVTNDAAITDALTGDTVLTNAIDATVPIAGAPNITQIRWDKLRMAGELFTTAFPFSLPFDIAKGLNAAFGDLTNTSLPDLQVNLFDTVFTFRFPQVIKGYMSFIRAFFLIMFDVSLVYSIRKWFGGAS